MNETTNIDSVLNAFSDLFPPKEPETRYEKILEFIKAFISGSFIGTVGRVLTTMIKTFGTIISEKYRVKTAEYVRDSYETECNAKVKMREMDLESEKTQFANLYIERLFQKEIKKINKCYASTMEMNKDMCKTYREYLNWIMNNNGAPAHLITEYSKIYMHIVQNSIADGSINMSDVQKGLDQILNLLYFLNSTNNYFQPFDTFNKNIHS